MNDAAPRAAYALRLGDDALVLAQRLGEWIAASPQLEEDVAVGNIGLDLLGQARSLLTHAGELQGEATGEARDEDDLAYFRDEREFTNVHLVELPDGDFGHTMARLLVFSAYQSELYAQLSTSRDATLAAIAAKALKEVSYHRDHATQWVLRLGDGTDESHRRTQAAVDTVWPYTFELFEADRLTDELVEAGVAADPVAMQPPWSAYVSSVLQQATLAVPTAVPAVTGGRRGVHTEQMGFLLAEMQHLTRSHPGATW
ncbi:MAG: phenylacetate-CoA oxygenase subunit PaaC [Actinomycetota bacterium]|nr:phenylacetate-CoA oxygenase subunit PaaC [Actinomycetota bacterium]